LKVSLVPPDKELRFHLKELHWDLTSLVKKVEALSAIVPDTPQALLSIRYGLVDVTSGIEHDVSHHLAEALKLVGASAGKVIACGTGGTTRIPGDRLGW
jgi:hypothetical protein